jgi:putative exosortase-associated protein (TIGR04073 family)
MRKRVKTGVPLILLAALLLVPAGKADAHGDPWVKLGRGLNNAVFGFLEIPNQVAEAARMRPWPQAIAEGLFKGLFYGTMRTGAGVYETATFLVPLPREYAAVMDPLPQESPQPIPAVREQAGGPCCMPTTT